MLKTRVYSSTNLLRFPLLWSEVKMSKTKTVHMSKGRSIENESIWKEKPSSPWSVCTSSKNISTICRWQKFDDVSFGDLLYRQ